MPSPINFNPSGPLPAIPAAPDNTVQAPTGNDDDSGHLAITREPVPDAGKPKLPLHEADPNFLRSPCGDLATSFVRPYLTPLESIRLAQTSRGLQMEVNGDPGFQSQKKYMQLRKNYVEQRQRLRGEYFDRGRDVRHMLVRSRMNPDRPGGWAPSRHPDLYAFLRLRTDYMAECIAIAREEHIRSPLPNYPMLEKIDDFLKRRSVTSKDLLAFEEELLACVDTTAAKKPNGAYLLHDSIWSLTKLDVADPDDMLDYQRASVGGTIDSARERLLDLTFSGWHSASDPVAPSLPPQNRVRFFHHPPATDWTADKVLEQQADVDPATGTMQRNEAGEEWTQSVAWPNPEQGETRHRFCFGTRLFESDGHVAAYSRVHVFNSLHATVNMDEPD